MSCPSRFWLYNICLCFIHLPQAFVYSNDRFGVVSANSYKNNPQNTCEVTSQESIMLGSPPSFRRMAVSHRENILDLEIGNLVLR